MRKILLALMLAGALLFRVTVKAQVSTYVFTASAGTYTPITTGEEIVDLLDDDLLTGPIAIGFPFVYNGIAYTQIQASSNGWMSFATTQTDPMWTNSLTNANTLRPALFPLWDDLDGFFDGRNFFETSGTFPNRVFTFEWRTFDWQAGASNNVISFQIKLFETSNIIQYVYRREAAGAFSPSATIGLIGNTSGDYLTLNNSGTSPTASSSTFTTNITGRPATGQVYQFRPPNCGGSPTAGTTASSLNPACYNTAFTLSITGATQGTTGLSYQWQSSPDGASWTDIPSATAYSYTTSITTSTWFRRAITCSATTTYSTGLQVLIQSASALASPATVCVNGPSTLTSSGALGTTNILTENFNGAATGWTTTNNSTGGTNAAATAWTLRPDAYTYTIGSSSFIHHSNDNSQFYLTSADPGGSGVTVSTILQSPAFSTVGYTSCSLQFYHYFKFLSSDAAKVEVSTNGTAWTTLATYSGLYYGTSSGFVSATVNLNAYINNPTLYIRFKYDAGWAWWWAVDNVTISGAPTAVSYSWIGSPAGTAGLPAGAGTPLTTNNSIAVSPTTIGSYLYTVSSSNGCITPGTVTVNTTSGNLATVSTCKTQTIVTGDNYFVDPSCNLIAKIVPQGAVPVSGSISTCVTINGSTLIHNGQPYVQRHFDIEPVVNPGSSTARITLYATQAEFDAANVADVGNNWPDFPSSPSDPNIGHVKVTQWHGTPTTSPSAPEQYTNDYAIILNPVSITWNATSLRWEIVIDVVGFSGFYIHTGYGYPLPVGLIGLSARRNGTGNLLNWKVPSEQNIRGYYIERSSDGQHFTTVGFTGSSSIGGNSGSVVQYQFTDNNISGERQYYRLRQQAMDGQEKLSTIVVVRGASVGLFTLASIFPNPASDVVNISLETSVRDQLTIAIVDINGREVLTKNLQVEPGSHTVPFTIESLARGTYMVKINCKSGCSTVVGKFIRQ